LGGERAVDRALAGDLDKARALGLVEWRDELERLVDSVDLGCRLLAIRAILGVNLGVLQPHGKLLERPLLARGVKLHGHGRAASERHQQQLVGTATTIAAAAATGPSA